MITSRTRVVLADDDVLLCQGLADLLGRSGHAVKVGIGLPNSVRSVGRDAIVQWA